MNILTDKEIRDIVFKDRYHSITHTTRAIEAAVLEKQK